MTTLYKCSANGTIRVWSITANKDIITIKHGVLHGAMQTSTEKVKTNLSGRSLNEQVCLRMDSRVNKRKDMGYFESKDEARANVNQNKLGLLKPMLARKFKDAKDIDLNNAWIQNKFNGHRVLVTQTENGLLSYSRNGKVIKTIGHIEESLKDLPLGTTIDGELYVHGKKLQQISSLIKKEQAASKELCLVAYDVIKHSPYSKRLDWLMENVYGASSIDVATTIKYKSGLVIKDMLDKSLEDGYEGLIIRLDGIGYEADKRSSQLLKLKKVIDGEFVIVDVIPSADGWAVFECSTEEGKLFTVSAPGTLDEKYEVMHNAEQYYGEFLKVEFFEYTLDNVPFHPVAIEVRDFTLG